MIDKDFDKLLDGLKSAPLDRDLTGMEVGVWERIDQSKNQGWLGQPTRIGTDGSITTAPALSRSAAVALAIGIGLVVGMLGAPTGTQAGDFSIFSIESPYAPSGLLG